MTDTRSIEVTIFTEYWQREDKQLPNGKVVKAGWKKPSGWPLDNSGPDGGINSISSWAHKSYVQCSLYQALTTRASRPAYLVAYKPTLLKLRLKHECVSPTHIEWMRDCGGVQMQLAMFDIDAPNHGEGIDVESWWENEEVPKVEKLQADMPGIIAYRSRNGYRLIALLPEIIHIESYSDSFAWKDLFISWVNYLSRVYGIKADNLHDWTRFQAVPHTVKEQYGKALELEVLGDVCKIGEWRPNLIDEDKPKTTNSRNTNHLEYTGDCQLLKLIQLAGLRCDPTPFPDRYDIHCPDHSMHSITEDVPRKTYLYTNGPVGKIECKSSGCQVRHQDKSKSYLIHFDARDVAETSPRPTGYLHDPACLAILERIWRRQEAIPWDSDTSHPLVIAQQRDSILLENAIAALNTRPADTKNRTEADYTEFAKWFQKQRVYFDPMSEQAYAAFSREKALLTS